MSTTKDRAASFKYDRVYEKVETTLVYESMTWSQFNLSYRNRYNRANLEKSVAFKRLVASMAQYGQISPGLVSSDGVIIKGQTRFTACRHLEIPFTYIVSDKTADELMIDMLIDGTTVYRWSLIDVANFYAECPEKGRGNTYYHLINVYEKTGIPFRDISNMNVAIGGSKLDAYDLMIRGNMPGFNKTKLTPYLELLKKLGDRNPFSSSKRIWVAVIQKLHQEYDGDYTKVKKAVGLFLQDICNDELNAFLAEKDIIGALNKTAEDHDFGFCFEASVIKR